MQDQTTLQSMTIDQLTAAYNRSAEMLGRGTIKKFKDKPTAIARIEAISKDVAAASIVKKTRRQVSGKCNFNYPVQLPVKPPKRANTKFAKLVERMLGEGVTKAELLQFTMDNGTKPEFTETTEAIAKENRIAKNEGRQYTGYCTSTLYRAWKELNNYAKRHGYGMRWSGIETDPIRLFDKVETQDAWDREHASASIKE